MIPTRERCQEIVKNCEAFYCSETEIDGFKIEMYNYMLAQYSDFTDNDAFELRGLTFVEYHGVWFSFLAMNKFFNINQNEAWSLDNFKDKKITNIQEKLDGSMITFIILPDNNIVAKTKMSFVSEQAVAAQKIYDTNVNIMNFVNWCFENQYVPLFELTSPHNQIVLEYHDTELTLLQIRDRDGYYFSADKLKHIAKVRNIPVATQYDYTLDELMKMKETDTGYEGVVVTFEDGTMAKIKLNWYLSMHGIISELRENDIIELTLKEELDDIMEIVTGEKKVFVEKVSEITTTKFNHLCTEFKTLRGAYFNQFKENRKEFAMENKNKPLFGWVMRTIDTSFRDVNDVNDVAKASVKEYILKNTSALTKAREWINS